MQAATEAIRAAGPSKAAVAAAAAAAAAGTGSAPGSRRVDGEDAEGGEEVDDAHEDEESSSDDDDDDEELDAMDDTDQVGGIKSVRLRVCPPAAAAAAAAALTAHCCQEELACSSGVSPCTASAGASTPSSAHDSSSTGAVALVRGAGAHWWCRWCSRRHQLLTHYQLLTHSSSPSMTCCVAGCDTAGLAMMARLARTKQQVLR